MGVYCRKVLETEHDRINYANKIISMQSKIGAKDRIIFACHKADLHPELIFKGIPNKRQFFTDIKNQYPGIFAKYMNKHPITRWWRPYNFDFLVFSSGEFRVIDENTVKYIQSNDKYPAVLWKSILKTVKGGWN